MCSAEYRLVSDRDPSAHCLDDQSENGWRRDARAYSAPYRCSALYCRVSLLVTALLVVLHFCDLLPSLAERHAPFPPWTAPRCAVPSPPHPSSSSLSTHSVTSTTSPPSTSDSLLHSYFSCTQLMSSTDSTISCTAASALSLPFAFITAGFAAVFDRMALQLLAAAGHSPPLILYHDPATVDLFTYTAGCASRDWTCLFQPITSCSAMDLSSASSSYSSSSRSGLSIESYYGLSEALSVRLNVSLSHWPLVELYERVPSAALVNDWQRSMHATLQSERVHRWLIVWAAAQTWLFQPNPSVQSAIDASKARMGWPAVGPGAHPIIGMHIRHGDKAVDGNPLFPLSAYMHQADRLRLRYPHLSTIYIATDDAESVLSELPSYSGRGWRILTLNLSDEVHVEAATEAARYASSHPEVAQAMAVDIIRVIQLLSECGFLIGQCMSQVYRTALAMSFALHRLQEPGIALDYTHCLSSDMHYYPVVEPYQPPAP